MPVNSLGEMVYYTTNQSIKDLIEFNEDDNNVEFIGHVVEILGSVDVGNGRKLFKAILSNGSMRILLLIWDETLVEKLRGEFAYGKILHLDACDGKVVKSKFHRTHRLEDLEIIIQPGSIVKSRGFHVPEQASKEIPTINFIQIAKAFGKIRVKAYIKTVVTPAYNRDGMLSFGNGSITEGVHKLPIKVTSFKQEDSKLEKGSCVMVSGTVSRSGKLFLQCQDLKCIEILNEPKLDEQIVTNANRPLKRWDPKEEEESKKKKDNDSMETSDSEKNSGN